MAQVFAYEWHGTQFTGGTYGGMVQRGGESKYGRPGLVQT